MSFVPEPEKLDIEALIQLLNHADAGVRYNAARELQFRPDARAVELLTRLLKSGTADADQHMAGLALDALYRAVIRVPLFSDLEHASSEKRSDLALKRL